jgi:hypothetical protein
MNIGELAKFRGGVSVDTISELTSASGVTIDGTILKDGGVTASGTVSVNTISEFTSGSGVTVDGVLLKDGGVNFGDETLNKYDEGTWTPAIAFSGNSVGVTYDANRYGHYTRIGNRCFFNCFFILTSKGSSTGQAQITGLPFTSALTANGGYSAAALQANGLSGTNYSMHCYVNQNSTTMDLYMMPTNSNAGAGSVAGDTQVSNTAQFMISGSYVIA